MANINNSNQANAIRPGSYTVNKVHLFTNLNSPEQYIDLTVVSQNITITESIFSMGVTLDVAVADATGILEGFKIMGNEKVEINISRTDVVSKEKKEYDLSLRIANIGDYSRHKESMQIFTLTCVSDYVYNNNLITLTNKFAGSIGESIKKICEKQLHISADKLELNSQTGNANGIYPRLRPLSAIKWLLKNITDSKTPFFFYERISDNKIVLESYKQMIDKDLFDTYVYRPYLKADESKGVPGEETYEEERKKIYRLSSDLNVSQLTSISDGCYGSTLHTLDIANKSYNTFEYNYNRTEKLNDNDSLSDNMKLLDKPIKEFTKGKNFFISKNSLAFGENLNNYSGTIEPSYLDSHSYLKNLNTLTIDAKISGDFDLKLGDKIAVNINRAGSDSKEDPIDKYLSGNYIIAKIVHEFKEKYSMVLTLKKDSFMESIDEIIEIKERETLQ